jgi:hypothetical protein
MMVTSGFGWRNGSDPLRQNGPEPLDSFRLERREAVVPLPTHWADQNELTSLVL